MTADWKGIKFDPNAEVDYHSIFEVSEILEKFRDLKRLKTDEKFIRSSLGAANSNELVAERHTSLFNALSSEVSSRCEKVSSVMAAKLSAHKQEVARGKAEKEKRSDFDLDLSKRSENTRPWTPFSIGKFWFLLIFSIVLLGISVSTVYIYATSTPLEMLKEHPMLAVLFSSVPIGLSIAFKGISLVIKDPVRQRLYSYFIWFMGVLHGIIWAMLFSIKMVDIAQDNYIDINDVDINSLQTAVTHFVVNIADAIANNKVISSIIDSIAGVLLGSINIETLIAFNQIMAEVFIAAGCWSVIENIYNSHHVPRLEQNDERLYYERMEGYHYNAIHRIEAVLAKLNAVQTAIGPLRKAYLAAAQAEHSHLFAVMLMNARAIRVDDDSKVMWRRDETVYSLYSDGTVPEGPKDVPAGDTPPASPASGPVPPPDSAVPPDKSATPDPAPTATDGAAPKTTGDGPSDSQGDS